MCVARLLLLVVAVCNARGSRRSNGAVSTNDPVLSKLRSQLMTNNYDYEPSESIEKALRMGGSHDVPRGAEDHTEDQPKTNVISDESELSDFGMDRNVLNGYITDMSDINVKPVLRANEDTFMADGQEPDTALKLDELSDAEQANLSESEPEDAAPAELSEERGLSLAEQAQTPSPVELSQPEFKADPAEKQPDQAVMRAQTEQAPGDELQQPELMMEEEQSPTQVQRWRPEPVEPAPAQRKIHVVSPYIAREQTTETIPYKVLTGHGQKQGRRSGAGVVSYLQTQFNDTVVVAPLGPGPMPDFQLPRGRRQYREISDDEDQEEEITSTKENIRRQSTTRGRRRLPLL